MNLKTIAFVLIAAGALYLWFKPKSPDWPIRNFTKNPTSIVAFGDSLTRGKGAVAGKSYPAQLGAMLKTKIRNVGKNGETTGGGLRQLKNKVLRHKPKMVLITLVGNDIIRKVPLKKAEDNLGQIFQNLVDAGIMVVYLSIDPPMVNSKWYESMKTLSKKHGVIFVDEVMDGLWGKSKYMSDQVHPNGKGYQIIAERVYERLKEVKVVP